MPAHRSLRSPTTSTCHMPMWLIHVEPDDKPDHGRRTLECVKCGRAEVWVVKYR